MLSLSVLTSDGSLGLPPTAMTTLSAVRHDCNDKEYSTHTHNATVLSSQHFIMCGLVKCA